MRMIVCDGCGQPFQEELFGDHPCSAVKEISAWMARHGLIPEREVRPSPETTVALDERWRGLMTAPPTDAEGRPLPTPFSLARDYADFQQRIAEGRAQLRKQPPPAE